MELRSDPRSRPARERCPYCHDQLEDVTLQLIECPGCRTQHHQACIQELGRCSVYGCEQRLEAGPEPEDSALRESPVRRTIRRRARERVRSFVRRNARPPDGVRRQFEDALRRFQEAEGTGDWREALATYEQLCRLELELPPGTAYKLRHVPLRELRGRALALQWRYRRRYVLLGVSVAVALLLVFLLWGVLLAIL